MMKAILQLTYSDMAMSQALGLVSDLKLGWYTSIPPREMFACQILGTVLGALTNCMYIHTMSADNPRLHLSISNKRKAPISRWHTCRSHRTMDWSLTSRILLRLNHLGCGRSRSFLRRKISLVVCGIRTRRDRPACLFLGA